MNTKIELLRKQIHIKSNLSTINSNILIIVRKAISYNTNLDNSHLLGISLVIIGGILFALTLLIPTFLSFKILRYRIKTNTSNVEFLSNK